MRQQGEITVFLSLCLLSITALICVMAEASRTAGSRYYFQVAVNGALDNLYSQYHWKLWQKYRILGMPYESEYEMSQRLSACVENYLLVENWYPMELQSLEISDCVELTDQGGDYLTREVLDYMAYGIWDNLELAPEKGEQLLKDMREASGAGTMTNVYDGQEKEVRKLEEAVERITECVRKQEECEKNIADELADDDPAGFRRQAAEFRKEEQKMDRLIQAYDRQAEKLREKMSSSRKTFDDVLGDFQEGREQLFEEQMNPYDAYINADGSRRQEILTQQQAGRDNCELLEQVERLVDELEEEYEESLEDEDSAEDALSLAPACSLWQSFRHCGWDFAENTGDKEKRGFLDQVKQMVQGRLLELVLPEGEQVSRAALPVSAFPSHRINSESADIINPIERMLLHEYCGNFFVNAVSEEKRQVQYEMEYLLQGKDSDRENLEQTVSQLFLIRQGLNLIHILSDASKRDEARTLAFTIAGASGIEPLVEIMTCFIMGVWAAAEAVADLRSLLSGGRVPLWKTPDDWKLSLENLLNIGAEGAFPDEEKNQSGISYESYLKLTLFLTDIRTLQMRMLDVMEMNIQREEREFLIDRCAYRVDICGKASGKHVFFALPIVENLVGQSSGYPLEAPAWRTY